MSRAELFEPASLKLPLPEKVARGDTLADRVQRQISAALPDGAFSVDEIALALDTSPRTLQRRLNEEGTSLRKLLEELRNELSLRYLAEPSLGIECVALMLGFSDCRAFRRAFKRWHRQSPSDHRKRRAEARLAD